MENISNVNAGTLSEMQKADDSKNTLPEKIVHQKSTNNDENVAFFWENNILLFYSTVLLCPLLF
jgi:hypothetical protein